VSEGSACLALAGPIDLSRVEGQAEPREKPKERERERGKAYLVIPDDGVEGKKYWVSKFERVKDENSEVGFDI
jgi:hypothetical protein